MAEVRVPLAEVVLLSIGVELAVVESDALRNDEVTLDDAVLVVKEDEEERDLPEIELEDAVAIVEEVTDVELESSELVEGALEEDVIVEASLLGDEEEVVVIAVVLEGL